MDEDVTVFDDSERAFSHLCSSACPDLVFLDLNVTPMSGLDLLRRIRSDSKLETVPVIIISGSQNLDDVPRAYQSGANCYITKPSNLEDFLAFTKSAYEFWGAVATLPG